MDYRFPEHRDSHASSSHGSSLEPTPARSAVLGEHSVLYSRPERPKLRDSARGPKSQGPRAEDALAESHFVAENVGDLITADHKVLSEGCESRNNHRYAVVVQDLATQWIQVVSVQNKNFSGNTKELAKGLGAE